MTVAEELARSLVIAGEILYTETVNETRLAVAASSPSRRVAFSAVGDTCPLCLALDGKVFLAGSEAAARFSPPLHINCDCIWVEVGDDEEGEIDWFTPEDAAALEDEIESHGHFVTNPDKYVPLKVPAGPSGRDFTVRRRKNPDTGAMETVVEWTRPRYELEGLDPDTVQTGVAERGAKWRDLGEGLSPRKPEPELQGVPGHPELLTEADRREYLKWLRDGPQPAAIPPTRPGPAGHVGSVGELTWNPADNDPDKPMPEAMREWLASRGFVGQEAEDLRRQLYRWSDRQYKLPDVQEAMERYLDQAPKYDGPIQRHLDLRVVDGKVDLGAFQGGKLIVGESVEMTRADCWTAGWRAPYNVVLVVDNNLSGASVRGFVKPSSLTEDEVVVPDGTRYRILSVQRVQWLRAGKQEPEELVVVRLRETDARP